MRNTASPCMLLALLFALMLFAGCPADTGSAVEGAGPGPANESQPGNAVDGGTQAHYENSSQAEGAQPGEGEAGEAAQETAGASILQDACADAADDYPAWALVETELVIWENADKTLDFRVSPEEPTIQTASPAGESETLMDMDFIGENEVCYAVTGESGWELGLFRLNGLGIPDNSRIFSSAGEFPLVDVSPISRDRFVVLSLEGDGPARLSQLHCAASPCREEVLLEVPGFSGPHKLAVSPAGTYFYFLHEGALEIFNSSSGEAFLEVPSVGSAVWAGDSHVLYSTPGGTFALDAGSGEAEEIGGMGEVSGLAFIPYGGGRIAYNQGGNAKVAGCGGQERLAFKQDATILAFAGKNTTMALTGEGFAFWRFFNADWTVRLCDYPSVFATVWKRY